MKKEIIIKSQEEMAELAVKIAKASKKGDIIGLKGTLGVGKTFFASAFINALSKQEIEVLSPTFNLVYNYEIDKGEIYHFDLYRIKSEEELYNIGIEDALINGISLIEWPNIAKGFFKQERYKEIEIKMGKEKGERIVIF